MKSLPVGVSLVLALSCGAVISYVDSRSTWDDTGVTAGIIFLTCAAFSFLSPKRWWVWVLAIGLWIPALGILQTGNYSSLLALGIAFLGAIAGMAIRNGPIRKPPMNSRMGAHRR